MVEHVFWLEGVGSILAPAVPLEAGTPLFLVRPDRTHVTALVRPLATKPSGTRAIAVDLAQGEVPVGTRVFGRVH